jgi:hypothetical protein
VQLLKLLSALTSYRLVIRTKLTLLDLCCGIAGSLSRRVGSIRGSDPRLLLAAHSIGAGLCARRVEGIASSGGVGWETTRVIRRRNRLKRHFDRLCITDLICNS